MCLRSKTLVLRAGLSVSRNSYNLNVYIIILVCVCFCPARGSAEGTGESERHYCSGVCGRLGIRTVSHISGMELSRCVEYSLSP